MNRIRERLRYEYRYYFVRRKAPLSSILWQRILRRRYGSTTLVSVSLAWTVRDADLEVGYGGPGQNHLTFHVYNDDGLEVGTVTTTLRYRDAIALDDAIMSAYRISRAIGRR